MRVQSLGQKDPLEKGTTTHSSILDWEIPWREEPGGLQYHKELDTTEQLILCHQIQVTLLGKLHLILFELTPSFPEHTAMLHS